MHLVFGFIIHILVVEQLNWVKLWKGARTNRIDCLFFYQTVENVKLMLANAIRIYSLISVF